MERGSRSDEPAVEAGRPVIPTLSQGFWWSSLSFYVDSFWRGKMEEKCGSRRDFYVRAKPKTLGCV